MRWIFRRLALATCFVISILVAMSLVWLFAPSVFGPLRTVELLALLALVILPFATAWAVLAERRGRTPG